MKKHLIGSIAAIAALCAGAFSVSAEETTAPAVTTASASETAALTTESAAETTAAEETTLTEAETSATAAETTTASSEAETAHTTERIGDPAVNIIISISSTGKLAVEREQLEVTDKDGDSKFTINDALLAAHDTFFKGGSEEGFHTEETQYGLTITRLWGKENNNSFLYYLNNQMAGGLLDPISENDDLYAFSLVDAENCTDQYSYLEPNAFSVSEEESEMEFTLHGIGFNSNWEPVDAPFENGIIVVDGVKTEYTTGKDGKVKVKLAPGRHTVSAVSGDESKILVPPVAKGTVQKAPIEVSVTISDKSELISMAVPVEVPDHDGDFKITIDDALYAMHERYYNGGAAAGYASTETQFGLSLSKLWGTENNFNYGYYVNDQPAFSLLDELKDDDYLTAFSYADLEKFSDMYTYFEQDEDDPETFYLLGVTFNDEFKPVTVPVEGASILLAPVYEEGEQKLELNEAKIYTDKDGKFKLTKKDLEDVPYYMSAVSEKQIIVPPVSIIMQEDDDEDAKEDIVSSGTGSKTTGTSQSTNNSGNTAKTGKTSNNQNSKTTAPNTGDRSVTAIVLTGLLALGAAFAARRTRRNG